MQTLRVTLSNPGGELDHRDVTVTDPERGGNVLMDALIDMMCGADLSDGDTVTVREIEGEG
jgi:hypothetical protein